MLARATSLAQQRGRSNEGGAAPRKSDLKLSKTPQVNSGQLFGTPGGSVGPESLKQCATLCPIRPLSMPLASSTCAFLGRGELPG